MVSSVSSGRILKDVAYKPKVIINKYDGRGNPVEQQKDLDLKKAYIWDYAGQYPIAECSNADSSSIAYTSFESDGNGNWSIGSAVRDTVNYITGRKAYNLSNGAVSKKGLFAGNVYIVSYWSKSGSKSITGGTAITKGPRLTGGWEYFEHVVTETSDSLRLSGSYVIDELRLYPAGAQMTSYTYEPMLGLSASMDANSIATYYDYDGFGRLKNVRDFNRAIVKNFQYNYANSCGDNCVVLPLITFSGSGTIGYPVGVFNVKGKLLGNAATKNQYLTLWNSDTSNTNIGTLSAATDSLHFNLSLVNGKIAPVGIIGCRYYQFDLLHNVINGIRKYNGTYVDFGDSTGMSLGVYDDTSSLVLAPNTTVPNTLNPYYVHTYPDTSLKTITVYHNDDAKIPRLDNDNSYGPATSLTKVRNYRGNFPQYMWAWGQSSVRDSSAFSIVNILNWNTITSITGFELNPGDGVAGCKNVIIPNDFSARCPRLKGIHTSWGTSYHSGCEDTTFKLTKLKSDWNTYFTELEYIQIDDAHWNREDLSALKHLNFFVVAAATQNKTNVTASNPVVPIPSSAIDNIISQISSGAGQYVSNGIIYIDTGGTGRTSASNSAVTQLKGRGWIVNLSGTLQ